LPADDRPTGPVPTSTASSSIRETHKATLSWKFAPNKMVYATYSTGYRPGGLNRRTGILPYKSDTLDNFEIGWKTSWFDRKLTIGGAVFIEKWKKLQFGLSPVGQAGVTNIYNAGDARARDRGQLRLADGRIPAFRFGDVCRCQADHGLLPVRCGGQQRVRAGRCAGGGAGHAPADPAEVQGIGHRALQLPAGFDRRLRTGIGAASEQFADVLTDAEYAAVGPTPAFTTADFAVGGQLGDMTFQIHPERLRRARGTEP
jgi:hypothetical protein